MRRRDRVLQDLDQEIRDHIGRATQENLDRGMSPEEARYAALQKFGNVTRVKEDTREVWGWMWLERFWRDLRYAGHGLRKNPVFTMVAVLSLALGIGATVTVFSIFDAVFFDAVTAKNIDQLKQVDIGGQRFSYLYYEELSGNTMLAGLAAYDQTYLSLRSGNDLEKVTGDIVSGNFFDVLGVTPFLGRTFTTDEGQARNQPRVVLLGYGFWERKFAGDVTVLGREIELNRELFTIVGVLPKAYRSIHGYGITPDVYVPISALLTGDLDDPANARLQLIARLRDGAGVSQAQDSLYVTSQQWNRTYPGEILDSDRVRLDPLTGLGRMRNDGVPIELTLFFVFLILAGGLVFLIACANVGGLLLARGANRSREIAVRLALGAPRHYLIQQLLTESFLLAFLGAGVGIALYVLTSVLLDRIQTRLSFPLELHLTLAPRLLAISIALGLLATLLSGLPPALQAGRRGWQIGSRQIGTQTPSRRSLRRMLVVGQFAIAFVLLVSAALLLRSLARISNVDPGFDVKHVFTAEVSLDPKSYSQERAERYFEAALAQMSRLPGVRSVSGATILPLGLEHSVISIRAGDRIIQRVHINNVTPGYFRTMDIPLLQGRDFQTTDGVGGISVAIVNETFAQTYLNNRAVGAQVLEPKPGPPITFSGVQIVGVVADSKYGTLGEQPTPAMYRPWSQQSGPLVFLVNSDAPLPGVMAAVAEALARLDPLVPVKLQLMQERIAGALFPSRIASALLGTIGFLGLLLAAVGIYGVMAYSVSRRTPEIGLRVAIGATRLQILKMILLDAFLLVFTGMLFGGGLAVLVTRLLAGVLASGISAMDPLSFGSAGILLSAIAFLGALIPAWRASRVDPIVALRYE
jgi:predicted permease